MRLRLDRACFPPNGRHITYHATDLVLDQMSPFLLLMNNRRPVTLIRDMWGDLTSEELIPFSAFSPGLQKMVQDSRLTVVGGYGADSYKRKV